MEIAVFVIASLGIGWYFYTIFMGILELMFGETTEELKKLVRIEELQELGTLVQKMKAALRAAESKKKFIGKRYKIHKKQLKTIDFEISIIELPENRIRNALTTIACTQKYDVDYECIVINICILNSKRLILFINKLELELEQSVRIKIREEIIGLIRGINPLI